MIPAGWVSTTTGDLIAGGKLEVGDGYRAKNAEFGPAGIPFLRIRNLAEGRLELGGADLFPEENLVRVGPKVSRPGDCVIATKATIGRMAYLDESAPRVLYSPQVSYWRVLDSAALDSRFISCWLRGREFETQAFQTKSSTSMADYINLRDQRQMRVTLPPIDQQRKIASVLATHDELIENNLRRIELLEAMAQALYREWFVDFRFPGRVEDALVDSPLGTIPEGWAVRSVVDLAGGSSGVVGGPFGSKLGRKDYVGSGVPVVRGANLNGPLGWDSEEFVFVSDAKFEELRGNSAQPGDIIVTQRGTLGQVGLIPTSAPWRHLVVSQSQMRVRVDPSASATLFVYQSLRWPSVNKRLVDHAMSSGVPHINLGILRDFKLAVPPLPLAQAYGELVSPMRRLAENLSLQNANLRSTRDLLLPKLVSGEIDVSELDIETGWLVS